ncbi:MAG: molybdopterin-dependent oxidoreductase [Chloroflexi bacterium]|nr:molybdopterin-dependent oxidoreductase [Chloroflexota bacterium]
MALTRRQFLKVAATSTVGAVAFVACSTPQDEFLIQSPVKMPEDLVAGADNWYASVCRQCPAGCGTIVRVMEGRAKKIEGNPLHPINRGKLCARGQAGLQALYHPDRLRGPRRRVGERGSGQFEEISWDEGLSLLLSRLKELQGKGQADTLLMVTDPVDGHLALLVKRFLRAFGGQHLVYEPMEPTTLTTSLQRTFGQDLIPHFDLENTQFLLSFGADFLETWLSPVAYGVGYGQFRQGNRRRGTLVVVSPRFSTTAASADEWIPIKPGTEGVLALSLAYVILSQGLASPQVAQAMTGGAGVGALESFRPEAASTITGIPARDITRLARDFAQQRPSLAIGGGPAAAQSNGLFNLSAVFALNFLVESVGQRGGVLNNPSPAIPDVGPASYNSLADWVGLEERLRTGQPRPVNLLLTRNANPVYGLPSQFASALSRVPYIVSFSSFMDETTAKADLILPGHVYLEEWGNSVPNPGPGFETIGWQQPVVNPVGDTRSFPDVLLALAQGLGGETERALPWSTFRDMLWEGAKSLHQRGSVRAADFESFWIGLLQRGGWWDTTARGGQQTTKAPVLPREPRLPSFSGEGDFHLILFPSISLGDGRGAHLPWLQGTPDPLTTVAWQTWVEMNAQSAQKMGLQEGDVLAVESPVGVVEALLYLHPAIPPGVVAMPMGQGHDAYGRYAQGRGANPLSLISLPKDSDNGSLAWAATRVRIRKTGQRVKLAKLEGFVTPTQLPGTEIVPEAQVTR